MVLGTGAEPAGEEQRYYCVLSLQELPRKESVPSPHMSSLLPPKCASADRGTLFLSPIRPFFYFILAKTK